MLWCAEPEVTAARVVWNSRPRDVGTGIESARATRSSERLIRTEGEERPPRGFPLNAQGHGVAQVSLWCDPTQPDLRFGSRPRPSSPHGGLG